MHKQLGLTNFGKAQEGLQAGRHSPEDHPDAPSAHRDCCQYYGYQTAAVAVYVVMAVARYPADAVCVPAVLPQYGNTDPPHG